MKKINSDLVPELFVESSATISEDVHLSESPLANRMRPRSLDEIVGQEHLLSQGKLLRRVLQSDRLTSIVLYGPPGCGKTSIAKVISRMTSAQFCSLNAVESSVAEIRNVIQRAKALRHRQGKRTILFVDEIHRFNKGQQDVLMPDVEDGTIVLIGSTTQNPSFAINSPMLSRAIVCELKPIQEGDIQKILRRALEDNERGMGKYKVEIDEAAITHIAKSASGDARKALNALEIGVLTTPCDDQGIVRFNEKTAEESCQRKIIYHDREGDYHYDLASAFIKSIRGSDVDAAVYWLAKMIYGGEDPRFIMRRLLIIASEDIGNADPQALILASAGLQAIEFVGMPEGKIILSQLVTYMSLAPKSNASYTAINQAMEDVQNQKTEEVPAHLRDANYYGAKGMGHGVGYKYAHDYEGHYVSQKYIGNVKKYYHPAKIGFEIKLSDRIEELKQKLKS